jgi:hypothetical protein
MKFTKGKTGNPAGRPTQSVKNLRPFPKGLESKIIRYLDKNFETVMQNLNDRESREKARIYCELLRYAIPKFGPRHHQIRFEDMDDILLDNIVDMLQQNAFPGSSPES